MIILEISYWLLLLLETVPEPFLNFWFYSPLKSNFDYNFPLKYSILSYAFKNWGEIYIEWNTQVLIELFDEFWQMYAPICLTPQ